MSDKRVTIRDVGRWYDSFHGGSAAHDDLDVWSAKYFYRMLNLPQPVRLLDVGCGTGGMLQVASGAGHDVAGLDVSGKAVDIARQRAPSADVRCGDAGALPWESDSFDVVTCLGALEHFLDIPGALREMLRVGKDTCEYMIVVPNRSYLPWLISRNPGTQQQDIRETLMTLRGWRSTLEGSGLHIKEIRADRRPLTRTWLRMPGSGLRRIARAVKALVLRMMPLNFQYQFVFLAAKA